MKTSQFLKQAKSLILNRNNWTKGALARDSYGFMVGVSSPEACKFCTVGAMERTRILNSHEPGISDTYYAAELLIIGAMPIGTIAAFNDKNTHPEVMRAWDKAIQTALNNKD